MGDNATVELATEESIFFFFFFFYQKLLIIYFFLIIFPEPMYVATDTTVRMPYNMTKSPTFASVLEIEVFLTDGFFFFQFISNYNISIL